MEQKFKTIEEIRNWWTSDENLADWGIQNVITFLERSIGESPVRPNKPNLSTKHTSYVASEYAKELGIYEAVLLPEYQSKLKEFNELRDLNNNLIVEFIKDESGFSKIVPSQYQDKVYAYAYQQGHSGGFSEIYNILNDLIGIFE